jgi:hypothetical protein
LKPAITSMTTALAPASMVIQDGTSRSSAAAGPSPPARSSQTIRVRAWRNPVLL